ncbi:MAG TPA: GWxTD domain-containing protein [Thermoanaerobaculia bacterium]
MRTLLALLVAACVAVPAAAETSPLEFARGPAQWLMTRDEQKAWRNVKTTDQAIDFIDLFWARRDPTQGKEANRNRLEFDARVAYADSHFEEEGTPGSLTERGRVLIVLGFPTNFAAELLHSTREGANVATPASTANSAGTSRLDPTGGRQLAAKDTWTYDHATAVKYGMPKIDVVFIYDKSNGGAHIDPQRNDFFGALPTAIKMYIVNADLMTVPEWASSKRSTPVAPAQETATTVETVQKTTRTLIIPPKEPVAKAAGAGKLTLLEDSMTLKPQSGADPFESVHNVEHFRKGRDLGWAAEYCSGRIDSAARVRVQLKLSETNGDSLSTDPEEFVPDSIKASPGCYLVRGALPLADVDPGRYKLTVTITGAPGGQSYNLSRDFRVE